MHYEPRNQEADAQIIEAGGLKSWGCYAFLLAVLVLLILLVPVHILLSNLLGDPVAWWASTLLLIGVLAAAGSLWIRRRRRQRMAQEQAWQRAMRS
jgi:LPXTG-motif cell wall-anchored protein